MEELRELLKQAKRAYKNDWDIRNREHIREYQKAWREKNREKLREYNRKYRENNKDKIKEHQERFWTKKALELRGGIDV